MKSAITAGAVLALTAGAASAAGVERSTQSVGLLFEPGTYAELSFGRVAPDVSGTQLVTAGATSPAGASSGDMSGDYSTVTLGFKTALSERLDLGLVLDQPIGADVYYPPDTGYLYGGSSAAFGGSRATLDSRGVSVLARYKLDNGMSVIGGLRSLTTEGNVALFNGYTLQTSKETDFGYTLGVAYEKPEIAMRVALTYNSAITHDFATTENGAASDPLRLEVPQSVNLDFRTGIAKDTLLFGGLRWVDWPAFEIAPTQYVALAGRPLVEYNSPTITYTLGLGRRFTPNWSGAVVAGYEEAMGGFSGNLGPHDGQASLGLALTYETERYKITGGVRYVSLGDATTQAPNPFPAGTPFGRFEDNHALAAGVSFGVRF